jgi:hypothetical protein
MSMLRRPPVAPVRIRHVHDTVSRFEEAVRDEARPAVPTAHPHSDWRLWLALAVSLLALGAAILNLALLIGAVPIPVLGFGPWSQTTIADTAGWATRGAASNAAVLDTHVFTGRQVLEFRVTNLSPASKAFVYTPLPLKAQHHTQIIAHLYVPPGAPLLVAAVYLLDKSWKWYSGPYPVLTPGRWTAVTYAIPAQAQLPLRELGVMILTGKGGAPYSGPLYLDSVDVRHADR